MCRKIATQPAYESLCETDDRGSMMHDIDSFARQAGRQNISRNHRDFRDAAIASDLTESYLSHRLCTSYACIIKYGAFWPHARRCAGISAECKRGKRNGS